MEEPRTEITLLLEAVQGGDTDARERLMTLVYEELRALAARTGRGGRGTPTLQPTALVHEAYVKLLEGDAPRFENRRHFFGAAARAMRQVLVDAARERMAQKRGGDLVRVTFADVAEAALEPTLDVLALNEALEALGEKDARLSEVVSLRYFVGLSVEETADAMGLSPATVKRDWTYARAWLYERMGD